MISLVMRHLMEAPVEQADSISPVWIWAIFSAIFSETFSVAEEDEAMTDQ